MARIHPSALIEKGAQLAADVEIGAYSMVGAHAEIAEGTWIGPHVVIKGHTRIGRKNRIFQFSSLGDEPQDKKYGGEPTQLEIGEGNTIREFCTLNCGTAQDGGVTRLGNDNWIMAYVHLAHDCQVGSHTIFANGAQLAGHAKIGDYAILGGFTMVHQFCRIGAHSITGISSVLLQDAPPFVTVSGSPASPYGINSEGLKRRGFSPATIAAIKRGYKTLYKSGLSLEDAKREIATQIAQCPELQLMLDFLSHSKRGIVR